MEIRCSPKLISGLAREGWPSKCMDGHYEGPLAEVPATASRSSQQIGSGLWQVWSLGSVHLVPEPTWRAALRFLNAGRLCILFLDVNKWRRSFYLKQSSFRLLSNVKSCTACSGFIGVMFFLPQFGCEISISKVRKRITTPLPTPVTRSHASPQASPWPAHSVNVYFSSRGGFLCTISVCYHFYSPQQGTLCDFCHPDKNNT